MAREVDLPALHAHDLRHTIASLAVSAGANITALQRFLGRASAAMTLDAYADHFDDDLDSVALALDQARMISRVGKCAQTGYLRRPLTS
jgi:integrase